MQTATLIREARTRAGLSQAELARLVGTSQPNVSAWERGRREPTLAVLHRIADVLHAGLVITFDRAPTSDLPRARTPAEHAERLVDVLLLADAYPARPVPPSAFPRMAPA